MPFNLPTSAGQEKSCAPQCQVDSPQGEFVVYNHWQRIADFSRSALLPRDRNGRCSRSMLRLIRFRRWSRQRSCEHAPAARADPDHASWDEPPARRRIVSHSPFTLSRVLFLLALLLMHAVPGALPARAVSLRDHARQAASGIRRGDPKGCRTCNWIPCRKPASWFRRKPGRAWSTSTSAASARNGNRTNWPSCTVRKSSGRADRARA